MKRKKGNADRLKQPGPGEQRPVVRHSLAALVLFIVVRMAAVTFGNPSPKRG